MTRFWPAAALLCASAAASADGRIHYGPVPAWVTPLAVEPRTRALPPEETGTVYLLTDNQVRVAGTVDRYTHFAIEVRGQDSVGAESQRRINWDPSYETLTVHAIRVRRGTDVRDALDRRTARVLSEERDLVRQQFNGQLSAVFLLDDVRSGDVVDLEYSRTGSNPVLGGKYANSFEVGWERPVQRLHHRLVLPASHQAKLRALQSAPAPVVRESGGEREYVWDVRDLPALQLDDALPPWFEPYPLVEISEFSSWAEVVLWALPLYRAPAPLPPSLAALVEPWRALPPEERAEAALRFVREEIRYFGVEAGVNTHRPHAPERVASVRYGDCKDKALLLATLLSALGIEAAPALVNTRARQGIDAWLPSPFAFDHVIVRARVGGRTYWLDATDTHDRGRLDRLAPADERRALVVAEGETGLSRIEAVPPAEPRISVDELYEAGSVSAPAHLTVTTRYLGEQASRFRAEISGNPLDGLGRLWLGYYEKLHPGAEAVGLPRIRDDAAQNSVVVEEEYRLPGFWSEGEHRFSATHLGNFVRRPRVARRTMPLAVPFPVFVEETTRVRLPGGDWDVGDSDLEAKSAAFHFARRVRLRDGVLELRRSVRTLEDAVAPAQAAEHLAALTRADEHLSFVVTLPAAGATPAQHRREGLVALGMAGVLVLGAFGYKLALPRWQRRRSRRFGRKATLDRGEAPAAPLVVASPAAREAHLSRLRCSCGGALERQGLADERTAILDARDVLAVRLRCRRCAKPSALYYSLGS